MKRTAFTLLELLLVLAIIATICGLGITSYQRQYARAQFKSGIIQVQVDLHKARLLAMQSGEAYLFRYVPGTSVYEIAPLKTLQEVLYRINGEVEETEDDLTGGSLTLGPVGSTVFSSESAYSDDLFSSENIEADMAARNRALKDSWETTQNVSSSNLGGSLTSNLSDNVDELPNSSLGAPIEDTYTSPNVTVSNAGTSVPGSTLDANSVSINFRDLNAQEKSLAKENSLAWRVNEDGVIVRKQTTGDVIFTVLRISKSTPSNLRTRRPKGSTSENSSDGLEGTDIIAKEKALGGSLTSIPDSSENSEGLGGGLNEIPGDASSLSELGNLTEEEQFVSFWSEPIIFYPNGKTSSAVLGLESVGDYPYYSEIAIRGMTGVARISSISAVPPGADPGSSVLTREQLFRLSNPMKQTDATTIAGLATSGSPGGVVGSATTDASSDISNALENLNETNVLSDESSSDENIPVVNYGTGRRSGYSFNGNVSSQTSDSPLGVSLDQNGASSLNVSFDSMEASASLSGVSSSQNGASSLNVSPGSTETIVSKGKSTNMEASDSIQENSTLNGGTL